MNRLRPEKTTAITFSVLTEGVDGTMNRRSRCESGGIGRHARLRTLWSQDCEGSSPSSRTFKSMTPRLVFLIAVFMFLGCSTGPEQTIARLSLANQSADRAGLTELVSERSKALLDIGASFAEQEGPLSFPEPGRPLELRRLERNGRYLVAVVHDGENSHLLPLVHEKGEWLIDLVNLGLLSNQALDMDTMPRIIR